MYNFIDTTEVSEVAVLPSEALQINGEYLENLVNGYRTLYVKGREALSPELTAFETGIRDGAKLKNKRYPARTITIGYQIIASSNEEFRAAYNQLAGALNVAEAQLIFNDEPEVFLTGTPSTIGEVEAGKNAVVGEFEIICSDPFKYSIVEYEAIPDLVEGSILLDYQGTYKSFPTLEAGFLKETETSDDGETLVTLTGNGDCGYVAFFNENEKIVQLGDPEELDNEEAYAKSQTLSNITFSKTTDWGTAAKSQWLLNSAKALLDAAAQGGNVGMGIASYAVPSEPKSTSGTLLYRKVTPQGAPLFYYTVTAKTTERTANSVKITFTITASLRYSTSYFGRPYGLQGAIYVGGQWHTFTIKAPSEYWKGQSAHTVNKTITLSGLSASTTSITGMQFKATRTDGTGNVTGALPATSISNLAVSPYVADVPETYMLAPSAFGSGDKWHGVSMTRTLPADASGASGAVNGQLTFSNKLSIGSGKGDVSQMGAFQALLVNGSGSNRKVVAGVHILKGSNGKTGKIKFFVNENAVETVEIDLSYGNKNFRDGVSHSITKVGDTITFSIGGIKKTYKDTAIENVAIHQTTFAFLQYGTKTRLSYNGLYTAKFVKHNCETLKDIPNKFSANDVVTADCKNGNIYLNGVLNQSLGALGNDWEEFYLTQGLNQIGFSFSDWVAEGCEPAFKVRYREVFL